MAALLVTAIPKFASKAKVSISLMHPDVTFYVFCCGKQQFVIQILKIEY
jgi:hypothetical protein